MDANKVEQILTNLLSNALTHTPLGSTVGLVAALPALDGYYTLTVRDTGPGIAAAEHELVFERFYQSPQNQAQGGTGLGLALSRELAELLGGTLTLASGPGPGAAFTLRFPAIEVADKSAAVSGEQEVVASSIGKEELSAEQDKASPEMVAAPAPAIVSPVHTSHLTTQRF